jgi:peptidylprolyl isomerase
VDSRTTWIAVTVAGLIAVTALGFVLKSRLPETTPAPESPDTILTVPPPPPAPTRTERSASRRAPAEPQVVAADAYVTTASGLKYHDFVEGAGATPQPGQTAVLEYTGWLQGGRRIDSSLDRDDPLPVVIGAGEVIAGWDEGVGSMKVGGKRQLVIPPELGYGEEGRLPVIPGNATLVFEVELVAVQ